MTYQEQIDRSKNRLNYLILKFNEKITTESLKTCVDKRKKFVKIINNIYNNEKSLLDDDRKILGKLISNTFYPKQK